MGIHLQWALYSEIVVRISLCALQLNLNAAALVQTCTKYAQPFTLQDMLKPYNAALYMLYYSVTFVYFKLCDLEDTNW